MGAVSNVSFEDAFFVAGETVFFCIFTGTCGSGNTSKSFSGTAPLGEPSALLGKGAAATVSLCSGVAIGLGSGFHEDMGAGDARLAIEEVDKPVNVFQGD